ncbi:MAG TPA: DUF5990 family protein [Phenylobacterium sp.]
MARRQNGEVADEVAFRLVHDDAPPVHDTGEPYVFGLQSAKGEIVGGEPHEGGLAFNFTMRVKAGPDGPVFVGPAASGPADGRFVYLSWKAAERGGYINRIKAKLVGVTWEMVKQAQASGRPIVADLTGWQPHERRPTRWRVD